MELGNGASRQSSAVFPKLRYSRLDTADTKQKDLHRNHRRVIKNSAGYLFPFPSSDFWAAFGFSGLAGS